MSKFGPILLIDDDPDDKDLFAYVINDLGVNNELIYKDNCMDALEYISKTQQQPFVIFCDINMPRMNGMEFKSLIDSNPELRKKSIPFIFYSTSVDQKTVNKAFLELTIQGFFQKGSDLDKMKQDIKMILEYWLRCTHPNSQ